YDRRFFTRHKKLLFNLGLVAKVESPDRPWVRFKIFDSFGTIGIDNVRCVPLGADESIPVRCLNPCLVAAYQHLSVRRWIRSGEQEGMIAPRPDACCGPVAKTTETIRFEPFR